MTGLESLVVLLDWAARVVSVTLLEACCCAGRIPPVPLSNGMNGVLCLVVGPSRLFTPSFILHLFRTGMDERPPFDTAFFFSSFLLS